MLAGQVKRLRGQPDPSQVDQADQVKWVGGQPHPDHIGQEQWVREELRERKTGDVLHLSVRARLQFHPEQDGDEGDDQGQPAPDQGA